MKHLSATANSANICFSIIFWSARTFLLRDTKHVIISTAKVNHFQYTHRAYANVCARGRVCVGFLFVIYGPFSSILLFIYKSRYVCGSWFCNGWLRFFLRRVVLSILFSSSLPRPRTALVLFHFSPI